MDNIIGFDHLGIPTSDVKPGERYSEPFKMYTADHPTDLARIQFHRFEQGCPLDDVLTTLPHIAFKVRSLEQAIVGQRVILGPYEPIPGYRVAAIDANGVPIEYVETELTDEEVWSYATTSENPDYLNAQGAIS